MNQIRHIVVATDFSDASLRAEDVAAGLASALGARLTLLHVYPSPGRPLVSLESLAEKARRQLADAAAAVAPDHPEVKVVARQGEAATGILQATADLEADLLVMGTHSRESFDRLMLGVVAEQVMRAAKVPVMTVGPGRTDRHSQ